MYRRGLTGNQKFALFCFLVVALMGVCAALFS